MENAFRTRENLRDNQSIIGCAARSFTEKTSYSPRKPRRMRCALNQRSARQRVRRSARFSIKRELCHDARDGIELASCSCGHRACEGEWADALLQPLALCTGFGRCPRAVTRPMAAIWLQSGNPISVVGMGGTDHQPDRDAGVTGSEIAPSRGPTCRARQAFRAWHRFRWKQSRRHSCRVACNTHRRPRRGGPFPRRRSNARTNP